MSDDAQPTQVSFAVVVPAHQAADTIAACLGALLRAGFATDEITVVNDGSTDTTEQIARAHGVRVLDNAAPTRPARARNAGAAHAVADVLVFVDADVLVHRGLKNRLAKHFSDPDRTAVIGSYDSAPVAPSVVSRYRNLLHHKTHQDSAGPILTFWSGLGAVRRCAFEAADGFHSNWEDIEDVELGLRLSERGGKILLDPTILGTHLKDWTLRNMFRTDLYGRAVPWTRLLLSGRMPIGVLNTSFAHQVSAGCLVAAAVSALGGLAWAPSLWVTLLAATSFVFANASLLRYFAKVGGVGFALAALPYHALHYTAALLGYAKVRFLERNDV